MSEEEGAFDNEKSFFTEKDEVIDLIQKLVAKDGQTKKEIPEGKTCLELIVGILDKYQEQSHLISPHLPSLMEHINNRLVELLDDKGDSPIDISKLHTIARVVYAISKVVGYKTASKHLPHEVMLLEPVLRLLRTHVSIFHPPSSRLHSRYLFLVNRTRLRPE